MNIKDLIDTHADSLTPQLRQAAAFIASNPIEVSFRSMRYIAGKTGLTPPTFSRLARSLGFDCYEELREACRVAAKDKCSGYHDWAKELGGSHTGGEQTAQFHLAHGQQSMRNIHETMVNADPQVIERVVELLRHARRVFVNAQMGQRHIGSYASYVASLAFDNWEALGVEPSGIGSQIRQLSDKDAIICLSLQPYATQTQALAQSGAAAGAQLIAITDSPNSPIAMMADEILLATTEHQHFFPSQLGVLYLLEMIIGLIVAKSSNTVQDNLRKIESFSVHHGEYNQWR